jgi:hypothetical protein
MERKEAEDLVKGDNRNPTVFMLPPVGGTDVQDGCGIAEAEAAGKAPTGQVEVSSFFPRNYRHTSKHANLSTAKCTTYARAPIVQ